MKLSKGLFGSKMMFKTIKEIFKGDRCKELCSILYLWHVIFNKAVIDLLVFFICILNISTSLLLMTS